MVYARAISPQQQLKLTLDPSVFQIAKPVFQVKKKNMGPGTNAVYAANHAVKWVSDESSKIKCPSQMA